MNAPTLFVSKAANDMATRTRALAAIAPTNLVEKLLDAAEQYEMIEKATRLGDFLSTRIDAAAKRKAGAGAEPGKISAARTAIIAQIGTAAGISPSTVGQILRGEIERPPDGRLDGFARVLGTTRAALLRLVPESDR